MKDYIYYIYIYIQSKETSSATTLIRSQMDIRIWQQNINLYGLKQSSKYTNGEKYVANNFFSVKLNPNILLHILIINI